MPHTLDQILPSLEALGVFGYWLIGLASALEAFFLTGAFVPGTLIVDAGGILVQRGLLDFFDLAWFVAIGSVLGSELSYWTGRVAMHRLPGRGRIEASAAFARAKRLFERRGGAALVIGRFLGPVAGLVPLAAAMAGMERRRFLIWNALGSVPYAFAHVALGYFLGDFLGRIGGSLTRIAVLAAAVGLALIVLWWLLHSALRLLPLAFAVLSAALQGLAETPMIARRLDRHPKAVRWIGERLDRTSFRGLPLTLLALVFLYVGAVWLDSVVDFLSGDPMLQLDMRLAELIHHFRSPAPVRIATGLTALGGWKVVLPVVAATLVWLALEGRRSLAAGLLVSVVGNTITVALLKLAFDRPRSALGYFTETSGSFPSGHAAGSVAVYGMLMYVLWRTGKLRAETALLAAGLLAFLIGASRIYLIEHYLSDVLNGWLVGALCLTLGIAVSEWLASRPGKAAGRGLAQRGWRIAGLAVVLALAFLAAANAWRYDHPRNPPLQTADVVLQDPRDLARASDFPRMTESLLGSPLRPISLIVFARDAAALGDAMRAAGWTESRWPAAGLILDALYAALEGREDPTVGTVAHFWRGQPNDLAFVNTPGPASGASPRPIKARFWTTEFVTADGKRAFAGTVGFGEFDGQKPGEAGRPPEETLLQGLQRAGEIRKSRIQPPPDPADAGSASSPPGEAVLIILP